MLFFKECKKVVRSLSFWIYCGIVFLMFFTQYFGDIRRYSETDFDTFKIVEDHDLIMNSAVNELMREFTSNQYTCYPFGFYKSVSLKPKKDAAVEAYIQEMLGVDQAGFEELLKTQLCEWMRVDRNQLSELMLSVHAETVLDFYRLSPENYFEDLTVKSSLTYERFTEIMGEIDNLLGGGSEYQTDSLVYTYSRVPMEPEEVSTAYRTFLNEDKITQALARLYSDYMGIDLALLPVFVSAAFTAADRRRRMAELVYTRKISSAKLIFTRYSALICMMFIPVLLTMIIALLQALTLFQGQTTDMAAMFTLPVFWLLPNLMTASACGMLLTEIFSAGTAIAVQAVWAFTNLMAGGLQLYGNISKFTLICRHNAVTHRDLFLQTYSDFVFNRIFYTALPLAAIALTACVYSLKRGGRFHGIRLFGEGGIIRRPA